MGEETSASERIVRYAVDRELQRMNTRSETGQDGKNNATTPAKNRTDLLAALAYAAVATTIGIASYVYVGDRQYSARQIEDVKRGIAENETRIIELSGAVASIRIAEAKIQQHSVEHDSRAAYWVDRIKSIRVEQITNTQAIALFKASANARFDAFTGREGASLSNRISRLEKWIDEHDKHEDK